MELNPIIARLLSARGILPDAYEEFFDPSLRRLAKPTDIPGVNEAVETILAHVKAKREIVVFVVSRFGASFPPSRHSDLSAPQPVKASSPSSA